MARLASRGVRRLRRGSTPSWQVDDHDGDDVDVVTSSAESELEERASEAFRVKWPEFVFHDPVSKEYLGHVGRYFAEYDVILREGDVPLAGAWAVPIRRDGTVEDLPDG